MGFASLSSERKETDSGERSDNFSSWSTILKMKRPTRTHRDNSSYLQVLKMDLLPRRPTRSPQKLDWRQEEMDLKSLALFQSLSLLLLRHICSYHHIAVCASHIADLIPRGVKTVASYTKNNDCMFCWCCRCIFTAHTSVTLKETCNWIQTSKWKQECFNTSFHRLMVRQTEICRMFFKWLIETQHILTV